MKPSKTESQHNVEKFMRLAKQTVNEQPITQLDQQTAILRARLLYEECMETIQALGVVPLIKIPYGSSFINPALDDVDDMEWVFHQRDVDIPEIIDGLCDVGVICDGTAASLGIPLQHFRSMVDDNNLEKFGPGHSFSSDGKLIKPPGFQGPKIKEEWEKLVSLTKGQ